MEHITISKDLLDLDCQLHNKGNTELAPLKPTHLVNHHERNADDRNSTNSTLLTRLTRVLEKLKCYEQITHTAWDTDSLNCMVNEDPALGKSTLSDQVEENIQGILESAQEYIQKLNDQLKALDNADQMIEKSTITALNEIDKTYQNLMDEICQVINKRRNVLRLEAEIYKNEELIPLRACRQEVHAQIHSTQHLIALAETMLKYPYTFNSEIYGKLSASANSNIGRIPEVPQSEEVLYVKFCRPLDTSKAEILECISGLGYMSSPGPVQISDMKEQPGCLLVDWRITDLELNNEEHTFILQKATGEVTDSDSNIFETVYEGLETSCYIRDLQANQTVTLRVRIKTNNVCWSAHRFAKTTIHPYHWEITNKNYVVSNNGKIAAKVTNEMSTLFAMSRQFDANHIIEFTFLESAQTASDDEGIALIQNTEGNKDTLRRSGSLMITAQGKIFMDGEEKLMQLPKIVFGTTIIITALRKANDTLRINIECGDKAVTYDWRVLTPLYFAARFVERNRWNFIVK